MGVLVPVVYTTSWLLSTAWATAMWVIKPTLLSTVKCVVIVVVMVAI